MSAPRLVVVILLALSIGPVFAVDVPAMRDYPNHLAVMSVLSRNGTDAANPFYQVAWTFNTNLAMELVVPPLARLIGLAIAGKTFVLLSQLLVFGGALAIERVVRGRFEVSPLAAALFLYGLPFAWGFLISSSDSELRFVRLRRGWPWRIAHRSRARVLTAFSWSLYLLRICSRSEFMA